MPVYDQREFPITKGRRLSAGAVKEWSRGVALGNQDSMEQGVLRTALGVGGATTIRDLVASNASGIAARNVMSETIPQFAIVQITGTDTTATAAAQVEIQAPTQAGITMSLAWTANSIAAGDVSIVYTDGLWIVTVASYGGWDWIDPDRTTAPGIPEMGAAIDPETYEEVLVRWRASQKLRPGAYAYVIKDEFIAVLSTNRRKTPTTNPIGHDLTWKGMSGPIAIRSTLRHISDFNQYKIASRQTAGFSTSIWNTEDPPDDTAFMCAVEKRESPFL